MKTILITAIGGDIAQGVASIIRQSARGYRLLGTDTHREHGGSLFVDEYYAVPLASADDYEDRILELIESQSVDIVIPVSEPEIGFWTMSSSRPAGIDWLMLDAEIVTKCLDKLATNRMLAELGLPVPWTQPVDSSRPAALPCILKDRFGSGSKNLHLVRDDSDIAYLQSRYPDAIYQELLLPANQEVTCAIYRSRDHRVAVLQMRRRLTGGLTSWLETIADEQVEQMCVTIANGISLVGSMNVQLRITQQGPRVFEINPRFSSTAMMRHELGFCDVIWSLDELEGLEIRFPANIGHKIAVRTHRAEVLE